MWWISTRDIKTEDSRLTDDISTDDGMSIVDTLMNQSKWGSRAAICAGFAAVLQAIGLFIS